MFNFTTSKSRTLSYSYQYTVVPLFSWSKYFCDCLITKIKSQNNSPMDMFIDLGINAISTNTDMDITIFI